MLAFLSLSNTIKNGNKKASGYKTCKKFKAYYVTLYKELLADVTAAAGEDIVNNIITSELLQSMIAEEGQNNDSEQANQESKNKLCALIAKLIKK